MFVPMTKTAADMDMTMMSSQKIWSRDKPLPSGFLELPKKYQPCKLENKAAFVRSFDR